MNKFATVSLLDHAFENEDQELPDKLVCLELATRVNNSKQELSKQLREDRFCANIKSGLFRD